MDTAAVYEEEENIYAIWEDPGEMQNFLAALEAGYCGRVAPTTFHGQGPTARAASALGTDEESQEEQKKHWLAHLRVDPTLAEIYQAPWPDEEAEEMHEERSKPDDSDE